MTKAELINLIADDCDLTKKKAEDALDTVLGAIRTSLINNGEFAIHQVGRLVVKERAARKGRNPQTNKEIMIPARKVVAFKPSSVISAAINGN